VPEKKKTRAASAFAGLSSAGTGAAVRLRALVAPRSWGDNTVPRAVRSRPEYNPGTATVKALFSAAEMTLCASQQRGVTP